MVSRCITVMFEKDCAEQSEEHMIVRFDPMDKFKRRCEFTINFAGQAIHDLDCMAHSPKPIGLRHLHVCDVGAGHSHNGLPVLFG